MFFSTSPALLLLSLGLLAMHTTAQLPIRLLSHNIRYAATSPFTGEKPWADRKPLLLNELKYNTLYNAESFICLQEVLNNQLVDIMGGLGSEWSYIGVGRNDGKQAGEYSPILYRNAIWSVPTWRTYWLSPTPDVPGKGWDAASVRIVTVGTFVHKATQKKLVGMCTHLDDQGAVSRTESARLILKIIGNVTATTTAEGEEGEPLPVFLGGDLNSELSGSAYQILNAGNSSVRDVAETVGWRYGDVNTFTGFTESTKKLLIDHVFVGVRSESVWETVGYAVLENKFEDGVYNSDHRAVVGDVVLTV